MPGFAEGGVVSTELIQVKIWRTTLTLQLHRELVCMRIARGNQYVCVLREVISMYAQCQMKSVCARGHQYVHTCYLNGAASSNRTIK